MGVDFSFVLSSSFHRIPRAFDDHAPSSYIFGEEAENVTTASALGQGVIQGISALTYEEIMSTKH